MPQCVILSIVVGLSVSVHAAEPTAEQIQQWIRDLDGPRFKTRELASRRLSQAGAIAAPALAKAARSGSAEASDRCLRILDDLAHGEDPAGEAAARRQLRKLADSDAAVAKDARAILDRRRNTLLGRVSLAGATLREEAGRVVELNLDAVADLEAVLPLLAEFPDLEQLSVSNRRFGDGHAKHLKSLRALQDLNLYRSSIGDAGLEHLVGLPNLRRLPLGETRVTDAGLKTIARITQLEYVGLRGTPVTDAGLTHLKDLDLRGLHLGETKITDAGMTTVAGFRNLREV